MYVDFMHAARPPSVVSRSRVLCIRSPSGVRGNLGVMCLKRSDLYRYKFNPSGRYPIQSKQDGKELPRNSYC